MIAAKYRSPLNVAFAALLVLLMGVIGWLAVRVTAVQLLSSGRSPLVAVISDRPEFTLGAATADFARLRGKVSPYVLPRIRAAAARLPLDARPYLLVGSAVLQKGDSDAGIKILEAGRRLNPRQRWIHALLLDRYLRSGRYAAAAEELAVLSRLVGGAGSPVAIALAQMSVAPETRVAVRRNLAQDPQLERSVLAALAAAQVEPATLFAIATPSGRRDAAGPDGWGTILVNRLVKEGRFRQARAVWANVNAIPPSQANALLYDQTLDRQPGQPPFNWSLASNNIAAVDMRANKFEATFYGRATGELINQLLVLPAGRYRFSHVVMGGQRTTGMSLAWSLTCEGRPNRTLGQLTVPTTVTSPRRIAVEFVVPQTCPGQRLALMGYASEFPTPLSVTLDRFELQRMGTQ